MYITMNSDYALRAMMHLASEADGATVPIARISKTADIPEAFLRQIIPRLRKAGLIRSSRGNKGGISLARPAHLITLLDILSPIEEHLGVHHCVIDHQWCSRSDRCPIHAVWMDIETDVRRSLAAKNLRQLAGHDKARDRSSPR